MAMGKYFVVSDRAARMAMGAVAAIAASSIASPTIAAAQAPALVVSSNDGFLHIIGNADAVVKGVMTLLCLASIATWTIWLMKAKELRRAKACLRKDIAMMSNASSLDEI